jgi:hypothetical protein
MWFSGGAVTGVCAGGPGSISSTLHTHPHPAPLHMRAHIHTRAQPARSLHKNTLHIAPAELNLQRHKDPPTLPTCPQAGPWTCVLRILILSSLLPGGPVALQL